MELLKKSMLYRLSFILIIGAIVSLSITLYIEQQLSNSINEKNNLISNELTRQRLILELQSDFKTQVQEWKNTLLRGHEPKQLEKYWGQVLNLEDKISNQISILISTSNNQEVKENLKEFQKQYAIMMRSYRIGHQVFIEDYNFKAGDQSVKGIDRKPSELLVNSAEIIRKSVASQVEQNLDKSDFITAITAPIIILSQFIVVVVVILVLKKQLVNPTRSISNTLTILSNKDLTAQIDIQQQDELGKIADGVQGLTTSIREMFGEFNSLSYMIKHASQEITKSSTDIVRDTRNSQENAEHSAVEIKKMSTTISEISEISANAAEAAGRANTTIQDGLNITKNATDAATELNQEIQETASLIKELVKKTEAVTTVIQVISSIAEQTNLLALNAAIEAARAGESGRGFAVVADEVRTLAQRTQESTKEIRNIIEETQLSANKANSAMEKGVSQTEHSSDMTHAVTESIHKLAEMVNEINDMNMKIAETAEKQSQATEIINKNIAKVNDSALSTVTKAEKTLSLAGNMDDISTTLQTLAREYKFDNVDTDELF